MLCRKLCNKDDAKCHRSCELFKTTFANDCMNPDMRLRLTNATVACTSECPSDELPCIIMCLRVRALVAKHLLNKDEEDPIITFLE